MSHSQLILLSSTIALLGTGMLTFTAIFGNLLTSNQTQKFQLTRGQTFKYHRLISILGVVLILLHPIPLVFAQSTTGISVSAIFVPFLAEKKVTIVAVGVFALYVLLIVLVSSLYMTYLKRKLWRVLHYGSYLFFSLSFWHGLSISDSFAPNAPLNLFEPKKIILEIEIALLLLVVAWRAMLNQHFSKIKIVNKLMILKLFQVLAVILMGVQLGVSYAHFMQMPGKLGLPLDCYILVQNQVISYRVKLAFIEIPSVVAAVAAALLLRNHRKAFWLTLIGAVSMVLMLVIWAIFIQPINQQIDGWTATNFPSNWTDLRYQWHFYHLFRLVIASVGMIALTLSLLVDRAKPAS